MNIYLVFLKNIYLKLKCRGYINKENTKNQKIN